MREGTFVGREGELQQLNDSLRTALSESGQTRFIIGEAGTGKSALFHRFVQRALEEDSKLVALVGICNAWTGVGDPYLPFREALSMLTTDASPRRMGTLTSENSQRLRLVMVRSIQVLLEVAPDLVGIFVPGAKLLGALGKAVATQAGWFRDYSPVQGTFPTGLAKGSVFSSDRVRVKRRRPLWVAPQSGSPP